ncbi:MAG: hypothetical protein PW789_18285 [Edaphobacter sp.]|uniref:hypothetical protein n=1 Tax=Edaphobacter sp. TaxID=1934404 RepID=UPI0023A3B811|nr:hypothetical protein [Edaphobacter sp.]MDE1178526.1 hypothetical protein [Edaphobacter sp.]
MMRRSLTAGFFFAVLFVAPLHAQIEEAKPLVFAFDVSITLSQKAAAWLKAHRESIVVSADYTGAPKPDAEGRANQIGTIDLGVENVEVIGAAGLVRVTGTKVDGRRLDWIKGPVMLNVNLFSGRHANGDNVLACDFFDGKLSSAVKKTPELRCSLIAEQVEMKHRH